MKNIILVLSIFCSFFSKAQVVTDSLFISGHYRLFHFNKPAQSSRNSSLIFILHGTGGSFSNMMKAAVNLDMKSRKENILIVYPEGYKHTWNECRKAASTPANLENIDENAFFSQMIDYFKINYKVDEKRVFVIGISGGGHMTYKLAMTMPEKIKAIAAIVASLPTEDNMDCVDSKQPISVMIVNSTSDPINPYEGGEVKISEFSLGSVRSTQQTFMYWATLIGYTGNPSKQNVRQRHVTDSTMIEKYVYKQKNKPEVVLLKVINGKHEFPKGIDVFLESWNFFKRQSK